MLPTEQSQLSSLITRANLDISFSSYRWSDTKLQMERYWCYEGSDGGTVYSGQGGDDEEYDVFMWDNDYPGTYGEWVVASRQDLRTMSE